MSLRRNLGLSLLGMLMSLSASADQFQWNDQSTAAAMATLIERLAGAYDDLPSIYYLCENCSDFKPGQVDDGMVRVYLKMSSENYVDVDAVTYKFADLKVPSGTVIDRDYREVQVTMQNGETADLDAAYVFLETRPNVYTNLAYMLGLQARGEVSNQKTFTSAVNQEVGR